jgi:hypothetical protein
VKGAEIREPIAKPANAAGFFVLFHLISFIIGAGFSGVEVLLFSAIILLFLTIE